VKRCLKCQTQYPDTATACPQCGSTSFMNEAAAGVLQGLAQGQSASKPKNSGAQTAMIWSAAGLILFGPIAGTVGIVMGLNVKKAIAADPSLEGEGMANAAIALGIVDWFIFVYFLVSWLSHLGRG
jgi:hypothetical protein